MFELPKFLEINSSQNAGHLRHFRHIPHGISPEEFVNIQREIAEHESLWLKDTSRQNIPAHRQTETIYLRKFIPQPGVRWEEIHGSEYVDTIHDLPLTTALLQRLAEQLNGVLGRALCARLKPESVVPPHIDTGSYYVNRNRYHFVLKSYFSVCGSADEKVTMRENELWWIDNKSIHFSINPSPTGRIHLIFDLMQQ